MSLIDAAVLQGGPQTALIYLETGRDPVEVTRDDFRRHALEYATAWQQAGIVPRDLVLIAHTQSLESVYAFWGALLLGAIPSMFPTLTEKLDPDIYMQGMAELVALSDVRAILTTAEFAPVLAPRVGCPVLGGLTAASASVTLDHVPERDDIAFLQHSSGTTGLQKGVALSHEAVLNQLDSYSAALALSADDVIVSWLPLYHDMGLIAGFVLPLVRGVPLVLMSPFDWVSHPAMLFRAIHDYGGTLCWLPNFAYHHCARRIRQRDLEGLSVSSMRAFINCSEPAHAESHQLFVERFGAIGVRETMLAVSYAMAENVFAVTQTRIGQPPLIDRINREALEKRQMAAPAATNYVEKVSCGPPIDGVQVKVLDGDGGELPDRHVGEIAIHSHCMLSGYYRRPDLNPFTADGWYRTGDMGYVAEGEVYVTGRIKDLIINAGKNVFPQDVEAVVNAVPGVYPGRAVAFGVPDEREGTELIAVVAEMHGAGDVREIGQAVRQAVARQMGVSVSYVQLVGPRWLIKTSSGKIARAANRQKWLAERHSER